MKNSCLVTLILVLINIFSGFGQKFRYITYAGKEVPFKKVNQVIQDTYQYTWLATDQGLFRFDGKTFEDYNTSLRSRYIKSIIPWTKDTLLFSNDTGIFKLFYDNNTPKISTHISAGEAKNGMNYPGRLFKDSKNRLWVGQLDGTIFLGRNGVKEKESFKVMNQKTPKTYFGEDEFGTIWVLFPEVGLFYYDELTGSVKLLRSFEDILHFYVEGTQIILVGSRILKLEVNLQKNITNQTQLNTVGKYFNFINKDNDTTYFLASETGLYSLTENELEPKQVFGSNDPHRIEELVYQDINDLYFSSDQIRSGGKIWISTSDGLGLLWSSYFQSVSGMSHDNVFSISPGANNEVLISQNNINSIKNTAGSMIFNPVLGVNRVTGITSFHNNIWYGTSDAMIIQYQDDKIKKTYSLQDRGGGIFYMFADHLGDMWFCQAPTEQPIVGVAKINSAGEVVEYDTTKGLTNRILVVNEGGRSELYAAGIGTRSYLYKYNRIQDRFENRSLPFSFKVGGNFEVHDLAVDQKGMVWMGTTDGLLKYDTERIQRIDLGSHTKNEIRSVCIIPDGGLWLATDTNGIIYLDPDGSYVFFDENSGTPSKVASYRSMILDSSKKLWVGTAEGAVYSSRSNPKPLATNIPTLNKIQINNKSKEIEVGQSFAETAEVKFGFTTITFPGDNIRYQYKLLNTNVSDNEAIDTPWSEPIERNSIELEKLKGGTYTLTVRAQKPGGYSWSPPVNIDFEVKKKWYKTPLGLGFLLILGIFGIWYFLRLWVFKKTQSLKASLSLKQKELSEKEATLISQRKTLQYQTEELKSTGTNIYLLYRLLRQIPKDASWDIALPVIARLVELPTGVDAFEIAFKKGDEIHYRGSRRDNNTLSDRIEEFNEKENLATYVLIGNKPIMINDFNKEIDQYINQKDDNGYLSIILVPFEQKIGGEAVFCVYGKEKNKFTQRDLTLIQILTTFLSISITDDLR